MEPESNILSIELWVLAVSIAKIRIILGFAHSRLRLFVAAGCPDIFYVAFDCGGHRYVVLTACHVLAPAFKPDVEALAAVGVVTEILADYYVAEIAPVAEEAAAATESYAAGRGVACVAASMSEYLNSLGRDSSRWILTESASASTQTGQ